MPRLLDEVSERLKLARSFETDKGVANRLDSIIDALAMTAMLHEQRDVVCW